mgnify:CR=1 FL=1
MQGSTASLVRRRRGFAIFALAFGLALIYYFSSGLHTSVKDAGFSGGLSRANVVHLAKNITVDEIYGLLHLTTTGDHRHESVLTRPDINVAEPIPLDVYAAGEDIDWVKEATRLNKTQPIVVFSKVNSSH